MGWTVFSGLFFVMDVGFGTYVVVYHKSPGWVVFYFTFAAFWLMATLIDMVKELKKR